MYDGMRVRVEASSFLFFFFFLFLLARLYLFGRPRLVFKWMLLLCPYETIFLLFLLVLARHSMMRKKRISCRKW